jgi:hypothetical protein
VLIFYLFLCCVENPYIVLILMLRLTTHTLYSYPPSLLGESFGLLFGLEVLVTSMFLKFFGEFKP